MALYSPDRLFRESAYPSKEGGFLHRQLLISSKQNSVASVHELDCSQLRYVRAYGIESRGVS